MGKILLVAFALLVLLAANDYANPAVASYQYSECLANPHVRTINTTGNGTWFPEFTLNNSGSPIRYAIVKYSSVSDKALLVTQSDDGFLDGYVCPSGSNCSLPSSWIYSSNIGQVAYNFNAGNQRRYSFAFESATGDAVLVYGVWNTGVGCDLAYKVLPAASSSFDGIAENCVNDNSSAADLNYTWIRMDANPVSTSEEMVVVGLDSTGSDVVGYIWNGTSLNNSKDIALTTSSATTEAFDVKYAADGSKAIVVAGNGTIGQLNYTYVASGNWAIPPGLAGDWCPVSDDLNWAKMDADPVTDDIMLSFSCSGSQLNTSYWNGAAWATSQHKDQGLDAVASRPFDFAWNASGSVGYMLYDTDTTSATLNQTNWSGGAWGTRATISQSGAYATTGAWLQLYRNPNYSEPITTFGFRANAVNFDIEAFFRGVNGNWSSYGGVSLSNQTYVTTYEPMSATFRNGSLGIVAYRSYSCPETTDPNSVNRFASWKPKVRFWNNAGTTSWGPEIDVPNSGNYLMYSRVKYSPISQKIVLVTQSEGGFLDAYVCNYNCTSNNSWYFSPNIAQVAFNLTAGTQRRYDIAFETATGDAVVFYSVLNTGAGCDIAFKELDANQTLFNSSEICVNDNSSASDVNYSWIEARRNPAAGSQEILVAGFDVTGSDVVGYIWDGSYLNNSKDVSTAASSTTTEPFAIAYSADGSKGMVVAGYSTTGNVNYTYVSSGNWAIPPSNAGDWCPVSADIMWMQMDSDPLTDDIMLSFSCSASELNTSYWNGAAWATPVHKDQGIDATATRPWDFAWNATASSGMMFYDTDTTSAVLNQTNWSGGAWGNRGSFSQAGQGPYYATTGAWLSVYSNPNVSNGTHDHVRFLGLRQNINLQVGSFYWNGTAFYNYNDTILSQYTGVTTYENAFLNFLMVNDTAGPTVFGLTVNATSVPPGGWICINASAVDSGGINVTLATVTYPNLTIINFTMSDTTADSCDAGSANDNLFSVLIPTGDTEGTITVNNTYANDTFNNAGFESPEPEINITVELETPITSCRNIDHPGRYRLHANLNGARCINITSNNVLLKGNGHSLGGGILIEGTSNVTLTDMTLDPVTGLDVKGTSDSTFANLTITNVSERGIYVRGNSNRNNFTNFSINTTMGGSGIWVESGVNNTFDCLGRNISRGENGSCVQETATEATECGGIPTGAYATDDWGGEELNTYDGDWSTSATGPGSTANMYVNYTLPASAVLATSIWQVKYGQGDSTITTNQTIPADCWNQGRLQFQVQSEPGTQQTFGNCWDGTQWLGIWASESQGGGEDGRFYEEAIWWGFETKGIFTQQNGTVVKNCSIGGFTHGAWLERANQSTLYNNTMHDAVASGFNYATGIMLNTTSFFNISANVIYSTPGYGAFLNQSTSGNFSSNVAYNSSLAGFHLESSNSNSFTNDSSYENSQQGFRLSTSTLNSFTRAAAYRNSQYGFELSASTYNSLTDSLAYNNTLHGVYAVVSASNYNTLRNVTSRDNGGYGIYNSQGSYNNLSYTYASNNTEGGIYIVRATNNFLNQTALQLNWKTAIEISHPASTGNNFTGVFINTTGSSHGVYINGGTGTYVDCASGYINGTGNGTLCLQDQANQSTLCGAPPSGKYACEGNWGATQACALVTDGDWSTYGDIGLSLADGNLYINYTKPSAASAQSKWQVKYASVSETNYSISASCWAQSPLQLRLATLINGSVQGYCWDGSAWSILFTNNGNNRVYEEAVWWDMQPVGIYSALENTTSRGCNISSFAYGIQYYQANGTIANHMLHDNWMDGMALNSSNSNTITNITAYLNNLSGVHAASSFNNTFTDVLSYSNLVDGVLIDSSTYSSLSNITAYKNTEYGIYLSSSDYINLTRSLAYNNTEGIRLFSSDYCQVSSSTVRDNWNYGMRLQSNQYNNYTNSTAYNNTAAGFYLYRTLSVSDDFNSVWDSTAYNNSGNGFLINSNANVLNFTNNTAYNNRLSGFNITGIDRARIANSTSYGNLEAGAYLQLTNSNVTKNNISANYTSLAALNATGTSTSIFENNTLNATSFALYVIGTSTLNNFTNNTLLSATGTLLFLDSSSNGNTFWWNNFSNTAGAYVNDSNDPSTPNYYNISNTTIGLGNLWFNVINGSIDITGNYSAPFPSGFASAFYYGSAGTGYPYNNTTSTQGTLRKVYGYVYDYGPITPELTSTGLSCGIISSPGTYTMTENLSSPSATCFNITAANVLLNCTGYSITGDNSSGTYGIVTRAFNTTILNCTIHSFDYGIYFANASYNGTAQYNNVFSNALTGGGILFVNSSNNTLASNLFCSNPMDLDNAGLDNGGSLGSLNSCDSFLNYTENQHSGCTFACTSLWHRFFGNVTGTIFLGTSNVSPYVYSWSGATGLNVYMTDYDSTINWQQLQAIGKDSAGAASTDDFKDLDTAFSSSSFRDNITATYSDSGSGAKYNDTYTVYSTDITDVPVFNSSLYSTAFKTGILWDKSAGGEYSGTQSTVWVAKVNTTQADVYGNYQYLISIPYTLKTSTGGADTDLIAIYAELQ